MSSALRIVTEDGSKVRENAFNFTGNVFRTIDSHSLASSGSILHVKSGKLGFPTMREKRTYTCMKYEGKEGGGTALTFTHVHRLISTPPGFRVRKDTLGRMLGMKAWISNCRVT
ncbi:hypothetical protein RB195_014780 [Necator americanus]|uniref:Uncharacterized protein n=1 Tax=Necator americanus TaxID=51031 RepID=A0ABR1E4B1_NECAM